MGTMSSRVLLVEDNPDDEALTLRALKKCGVPLQVDVARDGAEAVQLLGLDPLQTAVPPPDLVLLDIKLPKLSGLEVLRAIRNSSHVADLTVVMLTSSDEPGDVHEAERLSTSCYVRKPIDYDEFMTVIRRVVTKFLAA